MNLDSRPAAGDALPALGAPPAKKRRATVGPTLPAFLEFFAGSGLVARALKSQFRPVWANDICEKKAAVYAANHAKANLHVHPIERVQGNELPRAELAWASFPCQDLSLAGLTAGIHAERSGLVWQWLRVLDEMALPPPVLVAENVLGLVSHDGGSHYRTLHAALVKRGYCVGAVVLDAKRWVPQSRPRVFVIAVKEGLPLPSEQIGDGPSWLHPPALVRAAHGLKGWVWWRMPEPPPRQAQLADIIEWDAPCNPVALTKHIVSLIPPHHRARLAGSDVSVAPGYRRTRAVGQVLELRFDGIAGCLRTPEGGSSRQVLVLKRGRRLDTRLLTARETARLMGAPDSFKLPGTYNDGYKAMGDAVAVPVARHLARELLTPLAKAIHAR